MSIETKFYSISDMQQCSIKYRNLNFPMVDGKGDIFKKMKQSEIFENMRKLYKWSRHKFVP